MTLTMDSLIEGVENCTWPVGYSWQYSIHVWLLGPVWLDLSKFRRFGKILSLWEFFGMVLVWYLTNFCACFGKFMLMGKFFNNTNVKRLKNSSAIWSHWLDRSSCSSPSTKELHALNHNKQSLVQICIVEKSRNNRLGHWALYKKEMNSHTGPNGKSMKDK